MTERVCDPRTRIRGAVFARLHFTEESARAWLAANLIPALGAVKKDPDVWVFCVRKPEESERLRVERLNQSVAFIVAYGTFGLEEVTHKLSEPLRLSATKEQVETAANL